MQNLTVCHAFCGVSCISQSKFTCLKEMPSAMVLYIYVAQYRMFFNTFIQFLIKGPVLSCINKPTCIPSWHKHLKQLGITWEHITTSAKNIQGFDAKVCRHQPDLGYLKVSLNICLLSIEVDLEGCVLTWYCRQLCAVSLKLPVHNTELGYCVS